MSEEKFTPGKWTVHHGLMEPTFIHTAAKDEEYEDGKTPVICECYHGIKGQYPNFDHSELQANANLIAAAPEMYALLKTIADPATFMGAKTCEELRTAIEAVLKKARGEA